MDSIPKLDWADGIEWASDVRWDPAAIWLPVADVQVGTDANAVVLSVLRPVSASVIAETFVADIILSILINASAQIDAVTLTGAIDLIVEGLGLITDTTIESLTTKYTIEEL